MPCRSFAIRFVKSLSCFLSENKYRNRLKFYIEFTFQPWGRFYLSLTIYLFCILFLNYYIRRELDVNSTIKCFIIGTRIEHRFTIELRQPYLLLSPLLATSSIGNFLTLIFFWSEKKVLRNKPKLKGERKFNAIHAIQLTLLPISSKTKTLYGVWWGESNVKQ